MEPELIFSFTTFHDLEPANTHLNFGADEIKYLQLQRLKGVSRAIKRAAKRKSNLTEGRQIEKQYQKSHSSIVKALKERYNERTT